jgi:signal peptidase I
MTAMRARKQLAIALPTLALLAGCGTGKGGGTTIVVTTGSSQSSNPAATYRVPSGSMEPTYRIGEYIEVEDAQPKIGDVVVFHPPEGAIEEECGGNSRISPGGAACDQPMPTEDSGTKFLKRVVAGPGDTIEITEGHVIRNGRRESDSYIRPCPGVAECNFPVAIRVPAGEWFLLGDNRGESDDSRFWGPVPTSWIVGVVRGGASG